MKYNGIMVNDTSEIYSFQSIELNNVKVRMIENEYPVSLLVAAHLCYKTTKCRKLVDALNEASFKVWRIYEILDLD